MKQDILSMCHDHKQLYGMDTYFLWPVIAFCGVESIIYIFCVTYATVHCICTYIVKDVTSFLGAQSIHGHGAQ